MSIETSLRRILKLNSDFERYNVISIQYELIHLKGPLLILFGSDSSKEMIILVGEPFSVQLLMFGHDYIHVGLNVCSNIQVMQAGSKLEATNFLTYTIMPIAVIQRVIHHCL